MKINKSLSHILLLQKKGWYFTLTSLLLLISFTSKAQTVTVGTGTLTDNHCPIYSYYGFNYSQTIYLASELTSAGASGQSFITSISYYYNTPSTPENTWDHWVIYMKNSSKSLFIGDTDWDNGLTQVFSGTISIPATGGQWITINLDTPFLWDGTSNLIVGVNEDTPGYSSSPGAEFQVTTLGALTDYRTLLYYEDIQNPNPSAPQAANHYVNSFANAMFDLTPASICSGAPNNAFATSSSTLVCANTSFNLSLTNANLATGLSHQWQSSPNGTVWTNLGSSQNSYVYSIPSISATTYYQCITTCSASALSSTSTPIVVNLNPITNCYCTPSNVYCTNTFISNVLFESLSDNPTCDALTGYTSNTTNTVTINANQSYTISTTFGTQSNAYIGAWIDYNQDGTFDSNEYTDFGNGSSGTLTATINVPFTALGGNTMMRIKTESTWSSSVTLDPCSNSNYDGQTLDYPIYINAVSSCSGTLSVSDATSSVSSICENIPFTLNLINNDIASNISYQWQSSTDNVIWTNIGSPQTTVPFTVSNQTVATYYRCLTTCTTSSITTTSTVWFVTQNGIMACYCIPGPMDCTGDALINYVAFATMTNTSTCGVDGYNDFTGSVSSATTTAGQTYTLTTVLGYMYGEHVHAWIDFDQNGQFNSYEYTDLGPNNGNDTISYSITIPLGATPGTTRMRVRNISGNSLGYSDACFTPTFMPKSSLNSVLVGEASGETEDYLITILPPDCGSVNFPPIIPISGDSNICLGGTSTIDVSSSIPVASGITYQWHEDTGSGFGGPIPNNAIINAMPSVNTSYYCEIVCNSSIIGISDTILVNVNIVTMAPTSTSVTCNTQCNGGITFNASSTGLSGFTYSMTPAVGSFTNGIATNLCANTYTIDVANSIGCSSTQTIVIAEPVAIAATPSHTDITCNGLTDGIATVTVTGGISPLNFSWMPSGGTALTANNLTAGTYTFNIIDGNGCTLSQIVTILEPSPLSVTVTNVQGSCLGGSSGQAQMSTSGGTPSYSYNWTLGGTSQIEVNMPIGVQTCTITDGNLCSITETVSIPQASANFSVAISGVSTVCEQLEDSVISNVTGGSGSFSYSWMEMPTNATSVNPNFTYTSTIGSYSYNLTVTDNVSNCIVNSNTLNVTVNPSSNISGSVTTSTTIPVAGYVTLFKYLPFYTKFDSIASQTIDASGNYLFTSFTSGIYIVKATPSAANLQIAYGDTAVNWKTAKQIVHGCAVNDVQNIEVKALVQLTGTPLGSLSGKIIKGQGFQEQRIANGFKPTIPGEPIGGIVVKGGRNPGGQMFVQTITDWTTGTYTLQGLPANTGNQSYFILVDIPGLDTNNTYHRIINVSNTDYTGLDFEVDSTKINPIYDPYVGVKTLSAIENKIKVFPNPASNYVNIQYHLQSNSSVKIELFDILGKSVKMILPETQQYTEFYKKSCQTGDLNSGLYFIKITINGSESIVKLSVNN